MFVMCLGLLFIVFIAHIIFLFIFLMCRCPVLLLFWFVRVFPVCRSLVGFRYLCQAVRLGCWGLFLGPVLFPPALVLLKI